VNRKSRSVLEAPGKTAECYDQFVAAAALERGRQVATFNRRHFDLVPGLAIIEPRRPLGWLLVMQRQGAVKPQSKEGGIDRGI
jgi:hypothetical protein